MKEFIEKLIGRLEEEKRLVPYNRLLDTIDDKPKEVGQLMTYQRVIEIVNQLAEEYNNDVCEWEKGSSGYVGYPAYYSRCCTTNSKGLEIQTHIISDWKFCPYCGKKIKVVEWLQSEVEE